MRNVLFNLVAQENVGHNDLITSEPCYIIQDQPICKVSMLYNVKYLRNAPKRKKYQRYAMSSTREMNLNVKLTESLKRQM